MALQDIQRSVLWRRDPEEFPMIKDFPTGSNKDALILHARGKKLDDDQACQRCQDNRGPFTSCVIDQYFDPPMGLGACSNCIWGAHPDQCSLRKQLLTNVGDFPLSCLLINGQAVTSRRNFEEDRCR